LDEKESFITENKNEFEKLLEQFIALKSVSATGTGITETVSFLEKLLQDLLKAQVKIVQTPGNPIILAKIAGQSDKNVLFYGHYDVMTPGDLKQWKTEPFKLKKSDGRMFGRGVGDNKGQLMAQILGLYTYLQVHQNFPYNITLFIEGEEEQGSKDLAPTIKKLAKSELKDIDTAFVVDGSFGADGTHVLRMGNRGMLAFQLSVETGTHDNHSGNLGNIMENPFVKLLRYLDKIYDYQTNTVKIPHFYDGVEMSNHQQFDWINRLPYDKESIQKQSGINKLNFDKETYYENLMFKPTFNFSSVKSGYMGEGVKTIIPHTASITIDSRLVGKQSIPVIKDNLEALLKSGLDSGELKLKYLGEEPPSQTTALKEQTEQVYQAIVRATGKAYIEPAMPGTVPNYVWTDILKVPVFTIPYANYDQHNHDVNENLTEKAFLDGIRISYELCAVFRKN